MTTYDPKTRLFSGEKFPLIYHPDVSIGQVLLHQSRIFPKKIVQINADDGVKLTSELIAEMMIQIAGTLIKLGMRFGDVVGFCGKNTTFLAPAMLGCILIGMPINPVDTSLTSELIKETFKETKPRLIFCDHDQIEKIREVLNELRNDARIISLTETTDGTIHISKIMKDVKEIEEIPQNFKVPSDKVCVGILPTSGTTGLSKLVRVTHAQVINNFSSYSASDDDLKLHFYQIFSLAGFLSPIYCLMFAQTRLITSKSFSPGTLFDLIEKFKVTEVLLNPLCISPIVNDSRFETVDLSSIRQLIINGSFFSEKLKLKIKNKLNGHVSTAYGMTETGEISRTRAVDVISDSTGKLCANTQVKILMDFGSFGEVGDVGEILLRKPFNILDYLNNEKAMKDFIDDERWISTGDIGYFDEELNLFVLGRKRFIFKCNGNNVYPNEIEEAILQIPGILKVCVVGVSVNEGNSIPCAFIVKAPSSSVTESDVKDAVAYLEEYKQLIGGIVFVDDLPLTPSGKVHRVAIEEMACALPSFKILKKYFSLLKNNQGN